MNQEFLASFVILWAIILGGGAIVLILTVLGISIYNKKTTKKANTESLDLTKRTNGKHTGTKGGSHGVW